MVVTVNVEVFAVGSVIVMVVGLKLAVESFERPVAFKDITPVKPPVGVAVTVNVVPPPGSTVREPGVIVIE